MQPSRREFVKWVTASGIALSLSRLASAEEPDFAVREILPGRGAWNPAATGVGRIDGVAKVTGAKLPCGDFAQPISQAGRQRPRTPCSFGRRTQPRSHRPRPFAPERGRKAVRGGHRRRPARTGMRVPEFYAGDLLCPVGKTPLSGSAGGAVDLRGFRCLRSGAAQLRDAAIVKFGAETGPVKMPNYGQFLSRALVARPPTHPMSTRRSRTAGSVRAFRGQGRPVWARLPIQPGKPMRKPAMAKRSARNSQPTIRRSGARSRFAETQSVDRCFSSRKRNCLV